MKQILVVLVIFFASTYGFTLRGTPRSELCHGLDCPNYTVLNSTKDWEARRYEATKWIATNATAMGKDEVTREMFHKLFQYISGANEKGTKIPMTAPVMTTVIHGAGPNCKSDFTMHFMLSHPFWDSPIKPTDADVYITETPVMDVYVGSFSGFAKDADYINAINTLAKSLEDAKVDFVTEYFFEAGYDGPYTFRNRHNEVWVVSK